MMQRAFVGSLYLVGLAAGLLACGGGSNTATPSGTGDRERGRRVYLATCIACHNVDPSRDGAIGPAVQGASRELLEARILNASYPSGYAPKRKTALMPKQPQLGKDIPDLAAYLNP